MQLTRFTDYGLRILVHLAQQPDGTRVALASLSEFYNMNHNHVNKVSQKMASLGWIHSTRGKSGGISIAPASLELSIGEIVDALETQTTPIDCAGVECPLVGNCKLQGVLYQAGKAFMDVLSRYRLADVTDQDLQVLNLMQAASN